MGKSKQKSSSCKHSKNHDSDTDELETRLRSIGLEVVSMEPDGNCLFRCFAYVMNEDQGMFPFLWIFMYFFRRTYGVPTSMLRLHAP
jgi:hypothetical protein